MTKMIQINGMAHVILTVTSYSAAKEFYGRLLPFLGLQKVHDSEKLTYWVGGRTALGIQPCDPAYGSEAFVQARVGLHHLCFRAKQREDIDSYASFLREMGAEIVRGPQVGDWVTGYYYVLFEDPDKIRLEICHVPGEGILSKEASFNPASDF
jgi:catechol 2,3-dioxygenase-like lactoylglutathione lyase family enzyme